MKKIKELRTLLFTVAEVTDMTESLNASQSLRHLSGDQRRQIQETHDDLVHAIDNADGGKVVLHASILVSALQCGMMTQQWLAEMLDELSNDN